MTKEVTRGQIQPRWPASTGVECRSPQHVRWPCELPRVRCWGVPKGSDLDHGVGPPAPEWRHACTRPGRARCGRVVRADDLQGHPAGHWCWLPRSCSKGRSGFTFSAGKRGWLARLALPGRAGALGSSFPSRHFLKARAGRSRRWPDAGACQAHSNPGSVSAAEASPRSGLWSWGRAPVSGLRPVASC